MPIATPEAPEEEKSRVDQHYDETLSPLERERLMAVRDRHKEDLTQRLRDAENQAGKVNNTPDADENIADQEDQGGGWTNKFRGGVGSRTNNTKGVLRGVKKKGPLAFILTIVFGALGIGGIFFGGSLAPLMAVHNITNDLNDQLSALERRNGSFIRLKFGKARSGEALTLGCKGVGSELPIKCQYRTITKSFQERLKSVGIEVEGDTGGVFGNKIRPKTYKFQGRTYDADGFPEAIKSNDAFGRKYRQASNMKFLGLKGSAYVRGTLAKFRLTEADPELTGSYEDRVNKLMNRAGSGSVNELEFREVIDPETNQPTGEYTLAGDTSGKRYTAGQVQKATQAIENVKAAKPLTKITSTAFKAMNVLGVADAACSVVQKIGTAAVAAKVSNAAQLAEYALPFATLAMKMKAGNNITPKAGNNITPEDARLVQEFFMKTDARQTIPDIKKISEGVENATKPNPYFGMNAMDSELYKMSAGGGVASTSLADKNYSLGFGVNTFLQGAATFADVAMDISKLGPFNNCDIVQSWWVRGGGLVIGLIAGVFSGGMSIGATAVPLIAVTAGMFVVDYIINSALSGSIINAAMDEMPVERGAAFWTGMAVILGQTAQFRGMMPGNAKQIVAYQQEQNEIKAQYLAYERQSSNPLDITNPYSLTGTIALTVNRYLPKNLSASSLSTLPANLSSLVFGGLSSSLTPYTAYAAALDPARFQQCDDRGYKDIGIDADVQCNVRYVMPESGMGLDPLDVAQWMEDRGYVEPDTTSGLPKDYTPPNPNESQNLAIGLLKGMVNTIYDTREYPTEYAKFLDFCVYRVLPFGETYEENGAFGSAEPEWKSGKKCLETAKEGEPPGIIDYFRMYTFDKTVNDDIDNSPVPEAGQSIGGGGGARISLEDLKRLIESYGLPVSTADGVNGYEALLKKLLDNPNATWAAQSMLAGEKNFMDKGGSLKEYLNTAWLWFENGAAGWPDPYEINCQDTASLSAVSLLCSSSNFQVAGYQAENRKNDYVEMFKVFYPDSELTPLLQRVVENSSKASKDSWKYNDPGQQQGLVSSFKGQIGSATLSDISPNQGFFDRKTQFLTLILGKDPNIATALNSFAVSDGDLLKALKGDGYGYIGPVEKQLLSNMIMALYLFDSRNGSAGGGTGGGAGLSAVWGGQGSPTIYPFGPDSNNGLYGYGTAYGLNGRQHTGTDIVLDPEAPIYSPVSGTIRCVGTGKGPGTNNEGCGAFNDYKGSGNGRVEIEMDNGYVLILGHTSKGLTQVGQRVKPGDQVATNGFMNSWHVHVECRIPDRSLPARWRIVDPSVCVGGGSVAFNDPTLPLQETSISREQLSSLGMAFDPSADLRQDFSRRKDNYS